MHALTKTLAAVVLAAAATAACDCGAEPTAAPTAAEQENPPAEEAAQADPAAAAANEPEVEWDVDANGIRIRRVESGGIEIRGTDKWGNPIDTTYESPEFLKNALPVFERSLEPAQHAAVAEYAESLEE